MKNLLGRLFHSTPVRRHPRNFGKPIARPRAQDEDYSRERIRKHVDSLYSSSGLESEAPLEPTANWETLYQRAGDGLKAGAVASPKDLNGEGVKAFLEKESGQPVFVYETPANHGLESTCMMIAEIASARGRVAIGESLIRNVPLSLVGCAP